MEKFKRQIEEIFGITSKYWEEPEEKRVTFIRSTSYAVPETNVVTYDKLAELSRILGTTKINFTGNSHDYQLSSYSSGTDYEGEIEAWEVKF